jgi:hypothetical protein
VIWGWSPQEPLQTGHSFLYRAWSRWQEGDIVNGCALSCLGAFSPLLDPKQNLALSHEFCWRGLPLLRCLRHHCFHSDHQHHLHFQNFIRFILQSGNRQFRLGVRNSSCFFDCVFSRNYIFSVSWSLAMSF